MDELYKMNLGDFIDREEELDYQDRTIGLPYDDELKASSNVRYIDGFTQDDGNVIPSRWESFVPEENLSRENEPSVTGGIAGKLDTNILAGVPQKRDSLNETIISQSNVLVTQSLQNEKVQQSNIDEIINDK